LNPYFITGTGTDIGKTWVSCALLRHWRGRGLATCAFKPVLSGFSEVDIALSDAGALLAAQGISTEDARGLAQIEDIAPWRFAAPLSPDMAAALEGRKIDFSELVGFTRRVTGTNWRGAPVLVEGVGGAMVPLDDTHTVRDWIAAVEMPCVLVTGSYLGSLSHILTALAALTQVGVDVAAIVINESPASSVSLLSTIETLKRHASDQTIIAIERENPASGVAKLAAHLESRPVYTARLPDRMPK
jgi:dethiobiotin synthetase